MTTDLRETLTTCPACTGPLSETGPGTGYCDTCAARWSFRATYLVPKRFGSLLRDLANLDQDLGEVLHLLDVDAIPDWLKRHAQARYQWHEALLATLRDQETS